MSNASASPKSVTIDFEADLEFVAQTGDLTGEIPWHLHHQVREHCLRLSKQEAVGRMMQWFAAVPEIEEIRVNIELDHEYDDEGGFIEDVTTPFWLMLSRPLNRVLDVGGVSVDCSDIGDDDERLSFLFAEVFTEVLPRAGFRELANSCHSATILFRRKDFSDILAKPSFPLSEAVERVEKQK